MKTFLRLAVILAPSLLLPSDGSLWPLQDGTSTHLETTCIQPISYDFHFAVNFQTCKTLVATPSLSRSACVQLLRLYAGIFRSRETRRSASQDNDGDLCCPTEQFFEIITELVNVNGQLRQLVHLTALGMYQWVRKGRCSVENCLTSVGTCVLENTTQYLLVWNFGSLSSPVFFEPFSIPSYCSCKNI